MFQKRRLRDAKKNYCIYCKNLVTNFSRHIETRHPETEEGRALVESNNLDKKKTKERETKDF